MKRKKVVRVIWIIISSIVILSMLAASMSTMWF